MVHEIRVVQVTLESCHCISLPWQTVRSTVVPYSTHTFPLLKRIAPLLTCPSFNSFLNAAGEVSFAPLTPARDSMRGFHSLALLVL